MIYLLVPLIFISLYFYYKLPNKFQVYSIPNYRSSHFKKKISSAGIPIILSFILAYLLYENSINFLSIFFLFNIFIILFYGFVDDKYSLSQKLKLIIQLYLAFSSILYLKFTGYNLNFYIIFILFVISVFFYNSINFIDGSDGNLSLSIIIILINLFPYTYLGEYSFILYYLIISLTVFLIFFNFPPSKMFLGECGSAFISYLTLLFLFLCVYEKIINPHSLFVLFSLIISDISLTLIYRLVRYRYKAGEGHKDHFYQILVSKYGHKANLKFLSLYGLFFITPIFHLSVYFKDQIPYYFFLMMSYIPTIFLVIRFGPFSKKQNE